MQFDRAKLKDLILYVVNACPRDHLGAVKLHKVLYFTDMLTYVDSGRPMTGAEYRKRAHGPTCDELPRLLRELQSEQRIKTNVENYFGYRKAVYIPLVESDKNRFSQSEIDLIDEVIEFVCKENTARTISELSHTRAWEMADFGDVLPYTSAFYMFPSQVSDEAVEWARGETARLEAEKSDSDALAGTDYAVFRSRFQ